MTLLYALHCRGWIICLCRQSALQADQLPAQGGRHTEAWTQHLTTDLPGRPQGLLTYTL